MSPPGSTPRIADLEAVQHEPVDHHAEAQHEYQERHIGGRGDPADGRVPPSQRAHAEHDGPASAAHAGEKPSSDVTANPTSVRPSTTSTNTGTPHRLGDRLGVRLARPDRARKANAATGIRRRPPTSHGGAITAVKWRNDSPAARERQQVGQVGHRQQQRRGVGQMRGGIRVRSRRNPSARAVASTTGVSSTTVASRLSTAVVAAAMTNTFASSVRAARRLPAPSPRRPRGTGPRRRTAAPAPAPRRGSRRRAAAGSPRRPRRAAEITPNAISSAAAGTATTASGQPCGRTIANSEHHGQRDQRQRQAPRVSALPQRRQMQRVCRPRGERGQHPHRDVEIVCRHTEARAAAWSAAGRSRPSGCSTTRRAPTARTVSVQ